MFTPGAGYRVHLSDFSSKWRFRHHPPSRTRMRHAENKILRVPRTWRGVLFVDRAFRHGAVQEMKVGPSQPPVRREAANHDMLRWLKTVVVSDVEKAHGMRQLNSLGPRARRPRRRARAAPDHPLPARSTRQPEPSALAEPSSTRQAAPNMRKPSATPATLSNNGAGGTPPPSTIRFSPQMASVDRHELGVSKLSHKGGGPVCLTHHFISSDPSAIPLSSFAPDLGNGQVLKLT
jgi:hypothetical protein